MKWIFSSFCYVLETKDERKKENRFRKKGHAVASIASTRRNNRWAKAPIVTLRDCQACWSIQARRRARPPAWIQLAGPPHSLVPFCHTRLSIRIPFLPRYRFTQPLSLTLHFFSSSSASRLHFPYVFSLLLSDHNLSKIWQVCNSWTIWQFVLDLLDCKISRHLTFLWT